MKPIIEDFTVKRGEKEVSSLSPQFVSRDKEVLPPEATVVAYDKNGQVWTSKSENATYVATTTSTAGNVTYRVLTVSGLLFDPHNGRIPRDPSYSVVPEACFTHYIQYLIGKVHGDFSKAVRKFRS